MRDNHGTTITYTRPSQASTSNLVLENSHSVARGDGRNNERPDNERPIVVPYSGLWNLSSDALMPLQLLVNLKTLKLVECNLTHLKFLKGMNRLMELDISYCAGITALDDLIPTSETLASLKCVACKGITDVQPLSCFLSLKSLDLDHSGVVNVLALSHLPLLTIHGNSLAQK